MKKKHHEKHLYANFIPVLTFFLILSIVLFPWNSAFARGKPVATLPPGISWYEGSVESALALAKKGQTPLFVYWGAVWCPPCNQVKKTLFSERAFHEKIKSFIPLYLDGDSTRAQIWGEKWKMSGYPTLMVLSPLEKEVLRIPPGLQLKEVLGLLEKAGKGKGNNDNIDIKGVWEKAKSQVARLSSEEWEILSLYSWGDDQTLNLTKEEMKIGLKRVLLKIPPTLPKIQTRLFLQWAIMETPPHSPSEQMEIYNRLKKILVDPSLVMGNLEPLSYFSEEIFTNLSSLGKRDKLEMASLWERAMTLAQDNRNLSLEERPGTLLPALTLYRILHPKVPIPLTMKKKVEEKVERIRREATDPYSHHAVIGTLADTLEMADLKDKARELLLEEIKSSHYPYYFMSSLADLELKTGKKKEALIWFRQAYEKAEGTATKFQWGTQYLKNLLELAPQNLKEIKSQSNELLGELLKQEDAFSGRNRSRLETLAESFRTWNRNPQQKEILIQLQKTFLPQCKTLHSDNFPPCQAYFISLTEVSL